MISHALDRLAEGLKLDAAVPLQAVAAEDVVTVEEVVGPLDVEQCQSHGDGAQIPLRADLLLLGDGRRQSNREIGGAGIRRTAFFERLDIARIEGQVAPRLDDEPIDRRRCCIGVTRLGLAIEFAGGFDRLPAHAQCQLNGLFMGLGVCVTTLTGGSSIALDWSAEDPACAKAPTSPQDPGERV